MKSTKINLLTLSVFSIFVATSCYKEEVVNLRAEFDVTVVNEDYSVPVEISITNNSQGADRYEWTFAGGIPETSVQKQPKNVWYQKAGTYPIRLECWYKDRSEIKAYTLHLDSAIQSSFDTEIQINSFVPVQVQIKNHSVGIN
jgi:hypothetical protein